MTTAASPYPRHRLPQDQRERFLSAFSIISPHVRPRRHLLGAAAYRQEMSARLRTWREVTQTEAVG